MAHTCLNDEEVQSVSVFLKLIQGRQIKAGEPFGDVKIPILHFLSVSVGALWV